MTTKRSLEKIEPPSEIASNMARDAIRQLAPLLRDKNRTVTIRPAHDDDREITIPVLAFDLFVDILAHMANGRAVTVVPINAELTTQQAADLLNVSRPFLIKLLEENKIPFRVVGTHRRIRFEDLRRYQIEDDRARRETIDQLASEGQEQGFDY